MEPAPWRRAKRDKADRAAILTEAPHLLRVTRPWPQLIALDNDLIDRLEEGHNRIGADHEAADVAVNWPPFRKSQYTVRPAQGILDHQWATEAVRSVLLPLGEGVDIGQRPASLAIDHGETERCPLVHTRDRQDLTILRVDLGGTEQRSKQRDGERGQTGHQRHISSMSHRPTVSRGKSMRHKDERPITKSCPLD